MAGHFDGRTGQSGRTHVLDRHDSSCFKCLKGGFDQKLFGKRIADLDVRALRVTVFAEGITGKCGTVNSVLTGSRAEVDDRITNSRGGGGRDLFDRKNANAHRINQRVSAVARVEIHFTGNGWNTNAIAVACDASNDVLKEISISLNDFRLFSPIMDGADSE